MFASDLDAASRAQLGRGQRLVELLKQPQYSPFPFEEQAVSIWTGTSGRLDDVPVADIQRFEKEFLDHVRHHTKVLDTIRETGLVTDDTEASLVEAITEFKAGFQTGAGESLVQPSDEPVEALDDHEVDQEQIVKQKRG